MKLIKNIQIYAPENLGVKDVLISDSKIEKIDDHITYLYSIETIDGTGCILTPGLIDRHVHITGDPWHKPPCWSASPSFRASPR